MATDYRSEMLQTDNFLLSTFHWARTEPAEAKMILQVTKKLHSGVRSSEVMRYLDPVLHASRTNVLV